MKQTWQTQISSLFCGELKEAVLRVPPRVAECTEELRLRRGKPVMLHYAGKEAYLGPRGMTTVESEAICLTRDTCEQLLQTMSEYSLYARDHELRQGFISLRGGYRVGVAGRVVIRDGRIERISDIASFNIRIAREVIGASNRLLPLIMSDGVTVGSTLLISAPQMGKTTMLRDLCRAISGKGKKVCLVDERSEIAGCDEGQPRFDVGLRTDVLDACPKAKGIMMAIRTLSPDVIVTDELGREEDFEAIAEAARCGVTVITSLHAASYEQVMRSGIAGKLSHFECFVELGRSRGVGSIEGVYKPNEVREPRKAAGWGI